MAKVRTISSIGSNKLKASSINSQGNKTENKGFIYYHQFFIFWLNSNSNSYPNFNVTEGMVFGTLARNESFLSYTISIIC